MPEEGGSEDSSLVFGLLVCPDYMHIVKISTLGYSSCSMFMQCPKVSTELSLRIDGQVLLVAKKHHPSGRNEASKIILGCICEICKINAMNFSADFRVVVEDVCGIFEEVFECWVAKEAFV